MSKGIAALGISASLLGTAGAGSAETIPLTEQQKQQYYEQYMEIVEEVREKKTGIGIEVVPMEEFQLEDWVEPKAFEKRIQYTMDEYLKTERERLHNLSSTSTKAVANLKGEMTKKVHIYVSDTTPLIEVAGKFETQYNSRADRQLFSALSTVSTQSASSLGKWEQTSYEASLIDGGRTYRIRIEGTYGAAGTAVEKAFTVEFHCNEVGGIT